MFILMETIGMCFILLIFCVIDMYWIEHIKAWDIPKTEELKPYIPKKVKIGKWLGTIVGFAIISLIIALIMSNIL